MLISSIEELLRTCHDCATALHRHNNDATWTCRARLGPAVFLVITCDAMPHRLKCLELRNLPKLPTPLKSVNVRSRVKPCCSPPLTSEHPKKFRRTTPGSAVVLVTKHAPQPTSELFDPTYPGAHLALNRRHSLAPRWTSPHLTLYAFPKAFLSKPEAPYPDPYKPRPYPAPPRRPEQRSADMSMQVLAFKSRVVLRPTMRVKIKRRLKEAVRLIVTRGAAVEESRTGPKIVFCAEDAGADKWIAPGVLLSLFSRRGGPTSRRSFGFLGGRLLLTMGLLTQIGRMLLCPDQKCSACPWRNWLIQCVKHSCFFVGAFLKLRGF
jgi:hypothetical protein